MQIDTRFGPQDIAEKQIITFVNGIPGFEDKRRFQLFRESESSDVMQLLCVEDDKLTFPVVDPEKLKVRYEIALDGADTKLLESSPNDHLVLLVMLHNSDDTDALAKTPSEAQIQANLQAPLVINVEKRLAIQKVLEKTEQYLTIRAD